MTYTNEQAKEALREKRLQEVYAKIRLANHNRSVEGVTTYNLPYRVLWDYYSNIAQWDYMDIEINPWYPYPKIPKSLQLPYDQRRLLNREDVDKQEAEAYEKYRPWRLDTQGGLEHWKRYFTCFIAPYADDIDTWGEFDIYGTSGHDQSEIEAKRAFYKHLVQDFIEHPQWYEQRRQKQIIDYDLYDLVDDRGYMWDRYRHGTAPLEVLLKEQETAQEYNRRLDLKYMEADAKSKLFMDMVRCTNDYLQDVMDAIETQRNKGENT